MPQPGIASEHFPLTGFKFSSFIGRLKLASSQWQSAGICRNELSLCNSSERLQLRTFLSKWKCSWNMLTLKGYLEVKTKVIGVQRNKESVPWPYVLPLRVWSLAFFNTTGMFHYFAQASLKQRYESNQGTSRVSCRHHISEYV